MEQLREDPEAIQWEKPIPALSEDIARNFEKKEWKKVPITEEITSEPKRLLVIPNLDLPGRAMAWPAYYKETIHSDNPHSGFGELAEMMTISLQRSPLVKIRPELAVRLHRAQQLLDSNSATEYLKLVVVDGYRRLEVQDAFFQAYTGYLEGQYPTFSREQIEDMAQKMVAIAPMDPKILAVSPPPHSTGGSVDVVLVEKSKIDVTKDGWLRDAMIDFGADFDEMMHPDFGDERSRTRFYEEMPEATIARTHRRLLYNLMATLGFTNIPSEWWHFDYLNQQHAAVTGNASATFGFAAGIKDGTIVEENFSEEQALMHYLKLNKTVLDLPRIASHFGLRIVS